MPLAAAAATAFHYMNYYSLENSIENLPGRNNALRADSFEIMRALQFGAFHKI